MDPSRTTQTSPTESSAAPKRSTRPSASRRRIKAPTLPSASVPRAPSNFLYWSRTPVWGAVPARGLRAHSATLYRSRLFVFGGCDHRGCFRDLYVLDLDTLRWTRPHTTGTPPRPLRAHSATLVGDLIYIFGGGEGPAYSNETYILDASSLSWSKPRTFGDTPSVRRAHTAIYDDLTRHIYVFGGGNGSSALNDLYSLDVANVSRLEWRRVRTHGRSPTARGYHTANLIRRKMVVYGGSDGADCFGDVFILDLDTMTWSNFAPLLPAPSPSLNAPSQQSYPSPADHSPTRLAHTATQVGPFLFILAGHDGQRYRSDLLLFNLITLQFETRPTAGLPPSPRGYPTVTLYDSRIFFLGGFDGKTVFDDVHTLDLSTSAYLCQVRSFDIDLSMGSVNDGQEDSELAEEFTGSIEAAPPNPSVSSSASTPVERQPRSPRKKLHFSKITGRQKSSAQSSTPPASDETAATKSLDSSMGNLTRRPSTTTSSNPSSISGRSSNNSPHTHFNKANDPVVKISDSMEESLAMQHDDSPEELQLTESFQRHKISISPIRQFGSSPRTKSPSSPESSSSSQYLPQPFPAPKSLSNSISSRVIGSFDDRRSKENTASPHQKSSSSHNSSL